MRVFYCTSTINYSSNGIRFFSFAFPLGGVIYCVMFCFCFFFRFVLFLTSTATTSLDVSSPHATSSISQKGTDEPLFPSFTLSQGLTASSTVIFLHSGFDATPAAEFVTVWGRRRSKTTAVVSRFRRSAPAVIRVHKSDIQIIYNTID